jgi:hypothetical protein
MNQIPLLPVRLVDEQPPEEGKSRDLLWVGIDDQDKRYALKTVEVKNPLLPLTEWLCYHLCNLSGITTPDFAIVTRLDGSLAFGSRWEETAKEFSPGKVSDIELMGWLDRSKTDISGMFALDAFMPNEDRHIGNMLFVQTGPRLRALAFDWSRTRMFEPWPWPAGCNSDKTWVWLHSLKMCDMGVVGSLFARIKSITSTQVMAILDAAPETWRDNIDTQTAAEWWGQNRDKRAADASKVLQL